jgi:hypothetical protein
MSAIGMEGINECRDMGYSWPKAIRTSWEPKAWLGVRLGNVGQAISHAGDHLQDSCHCKD